MAAATNLVRLPPLPTIRDLVKLYRLRALKQLSQNFLMDERITSKIVGAAGNIKDHIICEVGPGPGGITRSIIRKGPKKLILVEKDSRFTPTLELLRECAAPYTTVDLVLGDILSYNLEAAFVDCPKREWTGHAPPIHLIGNLPFSVATHLIIKWLKGISERSGAWIYGRTPMTLTFQHEVAERMVAPVGHKQRCRLSVMCQLYCKVNYVFTIPGRAFVPPPDVDVGVVNLQPLKYPLVDLPFHLVEKLLRTMFNTRQKMSLKGGQRLFPEELKDDLALKLFKIADVNPNLRPFELSTIEYARLCYTYQAFCTEYPEIEAYNFRIRQTKAKIINENVSPNVESVVDTL